MADEDAYLMLSPLRLSLLELCFHLLCASGTAAEGWTEARPIVFLQTDGNIWREEAELRTGCILSLKIGSVESVVTFW